MIEDPHRIAFKIAFIFPGQGSQSVGMGKDLFDNFAAAREVFEEADDALGFKLSEMCFSGTEEDLALTANTQPAILTASVAAFRAMESEGAKLPDFAAGHSLGEYSASGRGRRARFCRCGANRSKPRHIYAGSRAGWRRSDGGDTRSGCRCS